MHCILQYTIVAIKAIRLVECWGLLKAGTALLLFGVEAIKINPAADAAGVMKERMVI
jgi:hypothetical protein